MVIVSTCREIASRLFIVPFSRLQNKLRFGIEKKLNSRLHDENRISKNIHSFESIMSSIGGVAPFSFHVCDLCTRSATHIHISKQLWTIMARAFVDDVLFLSDNFYSLCVEIGENRRSTLIMTWKCSAFIRCDFLNSDTKNGKMPHLNWQIAEVWYAVEPTKYFHLVQVFVWTS